MRTLVEIGHLIELRESLFNLTKTDFALYDGTGLLLLPAAGENPLVQRLTAFRSAEEEQAQFIRRGIEKAILRKGVSIFRGPVNQYHCFIPVHAGESIFVLVGNAFYAAEKDLEEFFASRGPEYGLSREDISFARRALSVQDLKTASEQCEQIARLFAFSLRDNYEKNLNLANFRKVRATFDFLFEIEEATDREGIFSLLLEAIIFIFKGDTVAVLTPRSGVFSSLLSSGSLKEAVRSGQSKIDSAVLSETVRRQKPLVFTESMELFRMGYPDEVTSLSLFPIFQKEEIFGLLGIYNSRIGKEEEEMIFKLCNLTGLILKTLDRHEACEKQIDDITAMNAAVMSLGAEFRNPEILYDSIVRTSSRLVNAEKASLMLPEDKGELLVKAVRGINKWIARNIRVKVGEGIAGRVYKEGRHLCVSDIERSLSTKKRPNYRTGSFVSVPLIIGKETIGVLNLADKVDGEVFSEIDLAFLRYFASYASIAIQGAHYYSVSEEMRTLSITDPLTGLFNRRYFDERLFEELQRAIRYNSGFSLAIFDIDDFKLFNDTEGHLSGDEMLKTIAHISRESLRAIDILARFGGEEFSIIMPQTEKDEAFLVAERVRKNIGELIPRTWNAFPRERVTVSIGIAVFPEDGKDEKTMIRNADKALYRAKVSGKDKTVVWETPDPISEEV